MGSETGGLGHLIGCPVHLNGADFYELLVHFKTEYSTCVSFGNVIRAGACDAAWCVWVR